MNIILISSMKDFSYLNFQTLGNEVLACIGEIRAAVEIVEC